MRTTRSAGSRERSGAGGAIAIVLACAAPLGCVSSPAPAAGGVPEVAAPGPAAASAAASCATGTERACGVQLGRAGDAIDCARGTQVCVDGRWSACGVDPTDRFRASAASRPLAVTYAGDAPGECTGNPCDPYCQAFTDTPDAAFTADAGATVTLDASTGGPLASSNVPPGFQSKGELVSQCTSPCTAQSCLEACQFDMRCSGSACVPFDALATDGCAALGGGIDVTVPTTCTGSGWRGITVCNRGDQTAPAGIQCYVFPGNSPQYPNASPSGGTLVMTTAGALGPGACETQQVPDSTIGSNGTRSLMCNPPPGNVTECNPYNNWSATKARPGDDCQPMTSTAAAPAIVTRLFEATCPVGTLPHWREFAYDATTPAGTSIEFRFRAATSPVAGSACSPLSPIVSDPPSPLAVAGTTDPATCPLAGDGAPCPKALGASLPQENLPCLQMDAKLVPSVAASPTLVDWTVTYDCRPEL